MATSVENADKIINDQSLVEEDLLDELDEIPAHIREARMAQFKKMADQLNDMEQNSHGTYQEILEERKFLDITRSEDRCVVHFFHPDFTRCSIVDGHLQTLSKKHFETRFFKISVDTAKFFVTKLHIQMLPTIICFKKGLVVDRIIGFEELGNTDNFSTNELEERLTQSNVVFGNCKESKPVFGFKKSHKIRSSGGGDDTDDDDEE